MCRLSAIADLTRRIVPSVWQVGLFGSATLCPGDGTCTSGASDVDIDIVHPVGDERAALDIRRDLVAQVDALGMVADVTLLSERELISTGFWDDEKAQALAAMIVACNRSVSGPSRDGVTRP